jgi:pilus assembly protein FimV
MTSHVRRSHRPFRNKTLGLAIALAIGISAGPVAQAGRLGHAHVVSEPGAPLQMTVPLLELSPEELTNLQVTPASASEWQNIGVQPPVPLDSMAARVEPGPDEASRVVRVTSTLPPESDAVDMLLHMRSSAGERLVQVTVLLPSRAAAGVQSAIVDTAPPSPVYSAPAPAPASSTPAPVPAAPAASSGGEQITVRPGQTLWGIAASHAVAGASIYQMLDAILLANPQAFIGDNMNLVRAGSTLVIPDDATVRAIDPGEARRIFDEQAASYARRRSASAAPVPRQSGNSAAGKVEAGPAAGQGAAPAAPDRDQLRLSNAPATATAAGKAEAASDARSSEQHELDEARQRVEELKSNVDALNRAAGGEGAATGSGGAAAAQPGTPNTAQSGAAQPGAAQSATAQSAAAQTSSTQPATAQSGMAGSGSAPVASPSSEAAAPATPAAADTAAKGSLSSWIVNHLFAVIAGVVVLLVLVAVWFLRNAGKRQEEDDNYGYHSDVGADNGGLGRQLQGIDLNLEQPADDGRSSRA